MRVKTQVLAWSTHTHCLAAHTTHVQSQPISVLVWCKPTDGLEKWPTAQLTNKESYDIKGETKCKKATI